MRNRLSAKWLASGACGLSLFLATAASAQDRPTDPSTVDILQVLVEKGVLSRSDADAVLSEARKRAESREGVVRVPYVPQAVRDQIKEEVRQEVIQTAKTEGWAQPGTKSPSWLDRISFNGDVRVRGEGYLFQGTNTPLVVDTEAVNADGGYTELEVMPFRNTIDNRFRHRIRGRFGVDIKLSDYISAGLRITAGDARDLASTNRSMVVGTGRYQVGFDKAYVALTPFKADSMFAGTQLMLGKFENPFLSTEAIFDRDLRFEGAAATVSARFGDGAGAPRLFLTGGVFPLDEYQDSKKDKFLFAGQAGVAAEPVDGFRVQAAVGLYKFDGVQGQYNTIGQRNNDYTAPSRVQFGNSLFNLRRDTTVVNTVLFGLASDFRVGAAYARAEFDLTTDLIGSLEFEGAKNFAFDRADLVARRVPGSSGDTLIHGRARIGHRDMDVKNAWSLTAGYRRIEADATMDLFTDSDFGLGGTDQKGFVVSGEFGLTKGALLTGTWYSARTIDLMTTAGIQALPIDTDTVQLDLTVKF